MNFGSILRTFDAIIAFRDAARRIRGAPPPDQALAQPAAVQGLAGHIEARLTNVVVAALKEAFDRDHARLELERAQLDEQRRRAEDALRLEIRRQAVERELSRLKLLAATALIGWIASVLLLGWRIPLASMTARATLALGWVMLLASLGTAFTSMGRLTVPIPGSSAGDTAALADALPLWLLIVGLGFTAATLLL